MQEEARLHSSGGYDGIMAVNRENKKRIWLPLSAGRGKWGTPFREKSDGDNDFEFNTEEEAALRAEIAGEIERQIEKEFGGIDPRENEWIFKLKNSVIHERSKNLEQIWAENYE